MKTGQIVRISALKFDGKPYRWWDAAVIDFSEERIVCQTSSGQAMYESDSIWYTKGTTRIYFWMNKPYVLLESYSLEGDQSRLYVHVSSPSMYTNNEISYRDYELDVIKLPGKPPEVLDEDEFLIAAERYGYSDKFIGECREALDQALQLVHSWVWTKL